MKNNKLQKGEIINFLKKKDYKVINAELGKGSFGRTVLVQDPYLKEYFVVKKFEPILVTAVDEFYNNFIEEIKILFKLNHINIVRIFNYYPYEKEKTGFIVMEYIKGKTLDYFLEDYENSKNLLTLNNLFSQLIDAFECIEKAKIIHRDIREKNILINDDGIVKVIDFGIGKILQDYSLNNDSLNNDSLNSRINRPETLPQEYDVKTYSSKTDMFYLAELLSRLINKNNLCNDFYYLSILNKMMEKDPINRYNTFEEINKIINNNDFLAIKINTKEKKIYQEFSNSIKNNIDYYTSEKKFNYNIDFFQEKLKEIINLNCFEDFNQNDKDLISVIVNCSFECIPYDSIESNTIKKFYSWFINLSQKNKSIVLNNLIYKLSTIEEKIPWDINIPF